MIPSQLHKAGPTSAAPTRHSQAELQPKHSTNAPGLLSQHRGSSEDRVTAVPILTEAGSAGHHCLEQQSVQSIPKLEKALCNQAVKLLRNLEFILGPELPWDIPQ